MNPDQHEPDMVAEDATSAPMGVQDATVNWVASEYIHPDKNGMWYVLFGLVVVSLVSIDVFLMKSWTLSVLVLVMAASVIIYARRPPQSVPYALSRLHGLYIGDKLYDFADFKAFGLIQDGDHHSIMLLPVKRFAPGVSVYFPEEQGEQIVDILGARLPMENLKLDPIDLLVRKLRL